MGSLQRAGITMSWIPSPFKSAAIGATVLFSEQLAPNCLWMNSSFGATPDFGGSWAAKVAASAMAMKNNTRIALLYARLLSAPIEDEVPEECVSHGTLRMAGSAPIPVAPTLFFQECL